MWTRALLMAGVGMLGCSSAEPTDPNGGTTSSAPTGCTDSDGCDAGTSSGGGSSSDAGPPAEGFIPEEGFAVTLVSGGLSDGDRIRVTSATGWFGEKDHPRVPIYEDFEAAAIGGPLPPPWAADGTPAAVVTDERAFFGSRCARFNANQRASGRYPDRNATEIYVSLRFYWEEYPPEGTGDAANFKYFHMSGSNSAHGDAPGTNATLLGPVAGYSDSNLIGSKGATDANSWYGEVLPQNVWNRIESFVRLSEPPGTANGRRYHKQNGHGAFTYSSYPNGHFSSPSGTVSSDSYTGEDWTTRTSAATVQALWIAFYRRDWQRLEAWADEIYVDTGRNAQARFELGPAEGFGTDSRERTLCPYFAWAPNDVEIALRTTDPTAGKVLYFIDRDGAVTRIGQFD